MTRPKKWLTTERVALVAAVLALIGAISAPIVAELTKADSPPTLNYSCLELLQKYVEAVQRPVDRERILPGKDGQSTLLRDPQAQYCHVLPEDVDSPSIPPG